MGGHRPGCESGRRPGRSDLAPRRGVLPQGTLVSTQRSVTRKRSGSRGSCVHQRHGRRTRGSAPRWWTGGRSALNSSAMVVAPSSTRLDEQLVIERVERLPDERLLAMTPSSDMPRREGWRDGPGGCLTCGGPRPSTRARYCTRACQQRSYRLRHQTPTADLSSVRNALQRRKALVAHTIYECGGWGGRLLRQRRCSGCNLFARAVRFGGVLPGGGKRRLLYFLLVEGVLPSPS